MKKKLTGSELAELAIQIEINGRDFYNSLTQRSRHNKARDIFLYLAGQEEEHIKKFEGILRSVQEYEPSEAYPQEYFSYMNALASQYIFTQKNRGKEIAVHTRSDEEAIGLGIGFEKDSIIFYEGMEKIVPPPDRHVVKELLIQEKEHLVKLTSLQDSMIKERS